MTVFCPLREYEWIRIGGSGRPNRCDGDAAGLVVVQEGGKSAPPDSKSRLEPVQDVPEFVSLGRQIL